MKSINFVPKLVGHTLKCFWLKKDIDRDFLLAIRKYKRKNNFIATISFSENNSNNVKSEKKKKNTTRKPPSTPPPLNSNNISTGSQ